MKTGIQRFFVAVMVTIVATIMISCNNNKNTDVDPIHGTEPVDTTWWSGTPSVADDGTVAVSSRFPLEKFYELGQAGDTVAQRKLVDTYRKQLTANVVSHYPRITSNKNIHFYLATGYAKDVKSGDGKAYSGNFRNELIIVINDPSAHDTVFLACGNGMLSPIDFKSFDYVIDLGYAEPWLFTILPGEGLAHHLPELQAWAEVAGDLHIPIRNKDGKVVSQDTYLNYLGRYKSVLFPYDVVDILNGKVYNKAGQEVNFDKRLEETNKANAKAAKAKAKPKAKKTTRRR